ncbi:MAG: UDP-N-acetylmuramoyl-L-alanine--D-glutamate ligase [Pirellulales bacterium]|nr:UDP-N-acetylmuramoyl-L-alanine--D-glutamate ligase [Pirellulales bacterium]
MAMKNNVNFRGRKVTILGLGHHGGGVAAARYCAGQGAIVTVTDLADSERLADSLASLRNVAIERYTLGRHDEHDFRAADTVVVNPAVRPGCPWVALARRHGATITSETELFLDACPAPVIAVTGTVGKSTTSSMLAAMLRSAGHQVWLGGNIGNSLLSDLDMMQPGHIVVLEISSFQLHWLSEAANWPLAAVITNCSPNHLDWHATWEHYVASKQRLLTHLRSEGCSVLNTHDNEVATWHKIFPDGHVPRRLESIPALLIPGEHNRINAALAAQMAMQWGANEASTDAVLAKFAGLPHRLAFVAEIAGRYFYNDSKSTTPASTIAALNSMDRPTWLLLGGADKQIDLAPLAREVASRVQGVAIFGAVADRLCALFKRSEGFRCLRLQTLAGALDWCWQQSQTGEAILLSPACASTDQFRDYTRRGEEFDRLVRLLSVA